MNGVSKISSTQDVMLVTYTDVDARSAMPAALLAFAQAGVVVDMLCQSAPRGAFIDFSFTTSVAYFDAAMRTIAQVKASCGGAAALISRGYSKLNLFGEEMVTSCGVAAAALSALEKAGIEIMLITTSDLDISLLVRAEDEDLALEALKAAFAL